MRVWRAARRSLRMRIWNDAGSRSLDGVGPEREVGAHRNHDPEGGLRLLRLRGIASLRSWPPRR